MLCVTLCVATFTVFAAEEQDGNIDPSRGFRALRQDFYALMSFYNRSDSENKCVYINRYLD